MLVAGALQTLAYAPFGYWLSGIISAAAGFFLLNKASRKESLLLGWIFGLGIFGSGASWVYVSIHNYGDAGVALAALLTILYVSFLSLFPALQFALYHRFRPSSSTTLSALLFASAWVATDWFRSWFLTGFPWLYLGHSHIGTLLSGLAPLGGVHLITWVCVLTGAACCILASHCHLKQKLLLPVLVVGIWVFSSFLTTLDWTTINKEKPISVAIAQGNIPQELKWLPEQRLQTVLTYQALSDAYWGSDIILWPETAIPVLMDQAESITTPLANFAKDYGTTLITGIPYRAPYLSNRHPVYHNSIISIGNGEGIYHKQKLVPFGEYVPLESFLRGLIGFFDLPMSSFTAGSDKQQALKAGEYNVSPFICYEIVYPEFVAKSARDSNLLITISNDAWFGGSVAPHQHLEIAQMRSLETGRYLVRGTNSGISAIVDNKGEITARSAQFEEASLAGTVFPASGMTPFMQFLSWPIMLLCFAIFVLCEVLRRKANAEEARVP